MIRDTPSSVRNIVGLRNFNFFTPATYIPTITQEDYDNGFINRFFVARINYFNVFETNQKEYNLTNEKFFAKTNIQWKITGPKFNVYSGKLLETTGVYNYNILRIREAESLIKNINVILNDPLQFWRGF